MFQSYNSNYERQKMLHTLIPRTYPVPKKQIIRKANRMKIYDKQYVCIWKEAIQAIAKAIRTNQIIYVIDEAFEDITIRGPDNFVTFIIPSNSLRRKLKQMRTKEEGIPLGTTTIINQGASNYILGRPTTNMFAYYAYVPPVQPYYKLVSTSSQEY